MNKLALFGAIAALAVATAGSAGAAVTSFTPGAGTPDAGYTVVDTFNTGAGITGSGFVLSSTTNTTGAQPATPGSVIPYLDVEALGTANIDFAALASWPVHSFEFDWGSIDSYNTLTIHSSLGDIVVVPGSGSFPNAANGNQIAPGTNGIFQVVGAPGETFSGITLQTAQNSFEIDNLAVAVPEPASWAMMILGFGAIGFAMRRRSRMFAAA